MAIQTASKKVIRGWAMFDWANSAYNLVITSTIFPAYFAAITSNPDNDQVSFFGRTFINSSLYNYAVAFAYLVIALLIPILTSIADFKGNKLSFMKFFVFLGSLACCGMYFFTLSTLELGIILFILAAIGYVGSLVFYNSYLPEIAAEQDRDRISAKGFSYGYVGSIILQMICFLFVFKPEWFGITDSSMPARISFLLVGIWWMGWSQITFKRMPPSIPAGKENEKNIFTNGFRELKKVFAQVKQMPVLGRYLSAFFFYSMGVQTVMLAATIFGSKELKLPTEKLIIAILLIQLVAVVGATVMARLSEKFGNFIVLSFVVTMWIGICVAAYYTYTETQFYFIAVVVGLVMGGIQSLSRSTYAKLMPVTKDNASFFSYYDVTEKIAIVLGMFSFGYIEEITGSMRDSIIALVIFFTIGLILLSTAWVRYRKGNHFAKTL